MWVGFKVKITHKDTGAEFGSAILRFDTNMPAGHAVTCDYGALHDLMASVSKKAYVHAVTDYLNQWA